MLTLTDRPISPLSFDITRTVPPGRKGQIQHTERIQTEFEKRKGVMAATLTEEENRHDISKYPSCFGKSGDFRVAYPVCGRDVGHTLEQLLEDTCVPVKA